MTSPKPDDRRDAHFDSAWRAASREQPSAELDAAIRAAARREVGAGPSSATSAAPASCVPDATRPERWWWPLAAAATIGAIAFGLLQLMPTPNGGVVSDMPAPSAKRAPAPSKTESSESASVSVAPGKKVPGAEGRADTRQITVQSVPAPTATDASSAISRTADPAVGGLGAPPAPPAAPAKAAAETLLDERTEAARAQEGARLPAADWIALIRRLRDEGKLAEAARELAAFRIAYTDHEQRLPPDLRDWQTPAK
jgi:hypothetical protein